MAATWVSENVQSNTSAASDKTLTFAATAFTAGDVVTIDVVQNNDTLGFPTANTPTGGTGVTWTLIKNQQGTTSQFTQTTAWVAVIPSDQTATFAQTTLRSPSNALSTRGVMRRWQGVNTTTPIRQSTGYGNNTSDPLITNTDLQLTQMKAGDAACASGGDWSAQTTITTQFDSGLSRTESINANEAGQMHFISYYQSSTLAADDADVRAEMDASAATGNWSAIMYALAGAGAVAGGSPSAPLIGPGSQGPMAWQWRQQYGVDATTVANDVSVVGLLPVGASLVADVTHSATVSGILPVGASLVADISHAANVAGILPLGATPVATVSHDATVAGILPLGAVPVATVTHDALVAGILPLGAVQVAITQLQVPTIGLLPVGASLVAAISHDALVAGILPVGAVPVATISHDATVAGILPVGASLVAPVSHNATVAGILPLGAVLVAIVSGAADISVVGVLTVGASFVASVSHQALVSGVLPLGTALVAPVSHTAAVAGILPVGLTLTGGVSHNANVTGLLPFGAVLVAFVGDAPVIVYPTAFEVLANWHLGIDINPSNLTVELASSSLIFVPDPSGLLLPLTPSNENLDLD